MTSFDEVVIMLNKFDSNSEHTFLPCRSFSAFYSKLYPVTSASFWKSTSQMPKRQYIHVEQSSSEYMYFLDRQLMKHSIYRLFTKPSSVDTVIRDLWIFRIWSWMTVNVLISTVSQNEWNQQVPGLIFM